MVVVKKQQEWRKTRSRIAVSGQSKDGAGEQDKRGVRELEKGGVRQ